MLQHKPIRVLITGGAGFIGSHLAGALLSLGHQVVAVDNFSTGSHPNIAHLLPDPNFRLVEGSVLDESLLDPLVQEADLVYHLAAAVGVTFVLEHLVETLETNCHGTESVIRLAWRRGRKKVILASTSEVYGKSPDLPYREDQDLVLGPSTIGRWGYACSKLLDEFLALGYHKERQLPVVILRLFNTVGPRQSGRYGMVIPRFVSQALAGIPITVYGEGTQGRCFTHVKDVVRAMVDVAQAPEAEGQVFNLGNDRTITINELAAMVKHQLNSDSPIVHVPYTEAYRTDFEDVPCRIPDVSKIQSYLQYRPETGLERIIHDVADWTVKERQAGNQNLGNPVSGPLESRPG